MSKYQGYTEAVKVIKEAILRSQYRAVSSVNKEQLSLYYGIGHYVSKNSREGFWGKGAIETISQQLQKELPGLRGFSAANIKFMRQFYETWCDDLKSLTAVSEIREVSCVHTYALLMTKCVNHMRIQLSELYFVRMQTKNT